MIKMTRGLEGLHQQHCSEGHTDQSSSPSSFSLLLRLYRCIEKSHSLAGDQFSWKATLRMGSYQRANSYLSKWSACKLCSHGYRSFHTLLSSLGHTIFGLQLLTSGLGASGDGGELKCRLPSVRASEIAHHRGQCILYDMVIIKTLKEREVIFLNKQMTTNGPTSRNLKVPISSLYYFQCSL